MECRGRWRVLLFSYLCYKNSFSWMEVIRPRICLTHVYINSSTSPRSLALMLSNTGHLSSCLSWGDVTERLQNRHFASCPGKEEEAGLPRGKTERDTSQQGWKMMWLQRGGDNYIDGAEIELPQSITGEFNVCWHVFLFPSFFKIGLPVLLVIWDTLFLLSCFLDFI